MSHRMGHRRSDAGTVICEVGVKFHIPGDSMGHDGSPAPVTQGDPFFGGRFFPVLTSRGAVFIRSAVTHFSMLNFWRVTQGDPFPCSFHNARARTRKGLKPENGHLSHPERHYSW